MKFNSLVLLLCLASPMFSKNIIDGKKQPERIPDKIAFRLFLRTVATVMESPDANIRASLSGLFEMYHFTPAEQDLLKVLANQLSLMEKKNEADFPAINTEEQLKELRQRRNEQTNEVFKSFWKKTKRESKEDRQLKSEAKAIEAEDRRLLDMKSGIQITEAEAIEAEGGSN